MIFTEFYVFTRHTLAFLFVTLYQYVLHYCSLIVQDGATWTNWLEAGFSKISALAYSIKFDFTTTGARTIISVFWFKYVERYEKMKWKTF